MSRLLADVLRLLLGRDRAGFAQRRDLVLTQAQALAQHLRGVRAEQQSLAITDTVVNLQVNFQ